MKHRDLLLPCRAVKGLASLASPLSLLLRRVGGAGCHDHAYEAVPALAQGRNLAESTCGRCRSFAGEGRARIYVMPLTVVPPTPAPYTARLAGFELVLLAGMF